MDKKKTYKELNGTTRLGDFLRSINKTEILKGVASGNLGSVLKALIGSKDSLAQSELEHAIKMAELDSKEQEGVTRRWEADANSDSWLATNIRPLSLAFTLFSTIALAVIDTLSLKVEVEDKWVDLLQSLLLTIVGAYFGSRAFEKVSKYRKND